jgi:hypothetical protein
MRSAATGAASVNSYAAVCVLWTPVGASLWHTGGHGRRSIGSTQGRCANRPTRVVAGEVE